MNNADWVIPVSFAMMTRYWHHSF